MSLAPIPPDSIHVVGAAILRQRRCLIGQREPGASFGGLWEFPGGKVEVDEAPEHALVREIKEELEATILVGRFLARGEALHHGRRIILDVFAAELVSPMQNIVARVHAHVMWADLEALATLPFAPADLPALPLVRELL